DAYLRAAAAISCGVYKRGHRLAARAVDNLTAHLGAEHATEMLGPLLLESAHTAYALKRSGDGAEYFAEAERLAGRTGETRTFNLFFGPTNVSFWRIPAGADGGNPDEAVKVALSTNPAVLPMPNRQGYFHMDSARALVRVGRDKQAARHILTAERTAPQLVRASPTAIETARGLRDRIGGS